MSEFIISIDPIEIGITDIEDPIQIYFEDDTQLITISMDSGKDGHDGYTPIKGIDYFDGSQGIQGDQGIQGIQGLKGDTGDQGLQGIQGVKGDTGSQGLKGDTGSQGEKGTTGDQGIQGVKGDTGNQGEKGNTGDQGLQGIQGEKGDTGDQGETGDDGMSRFTFVLHRGENATTGIDKCNSIIVERACTISKAYAYAKTVPTGTALIFDINVNGVTIWSTQANRLQIVATAHSGTQTSFNTTSLVENDLITIDIDQIGSILSGADITVILKVA